MGQYLTPAPVARLMASMLNNPVPHVSILDAGAELVRARCRLSRIPFVLLERAPAADYDAWLAAALGAVDRVLSAS